MKRQLAIWFPVVLLVPRVLLFMYEKFTIPLS